MYYEANDRVPDWLAKVVYECTTTSNVVSDLCEPTSPMNVSLRQKYFYIIRPVHTLPAVDYPNTYRQ